MASRKKFVVVASLTTVVLAAVVASGLVVALRPGGTSASVGTKRVIYMSAVEYKGGTSVTSESFPTTAPPSGGGYILKSPDATGRWETSTYRWEPGTIVVNRGDEVELWIWGVNGALHDAEIEGLTSEFTVMRGQLTIVNFTASKPGIYRITCHTHQPSMEADLVVLPFRSPVR